MANIASMMHEIGLAGAFTLFGCSFVVTDGNSVPRMSTWRTTAGHHAGRRTSRRRNIAATAAPSASTSPQEVGLWLPPARRQPHPDFPLVWLVVSVVPVLPPAAVVSALLPPVVAEPPDAEVALVTMPPAPPALVALPPVVAATPPLPPPFVVTPPVGALVTPVPPAPPVPPATDPPPGPTPDPWVVDSNAPMSFAVARVRYSRVTVSSL